MTPAWRGGGVIAPGRSPSPGRRDQRHAGRRREASHPYRHDRRDQLQADAPECPYRRHRRVGQQGPDSAHGRRGGAFDSKVLATGRHSASSSRRRAGPTMPASSIDHDRRSRSNDEWSRRLNTQTAERHREESVDRGIVRSIGPSDGPEDFPNDSTPLAGASCWRPPWWRTPRASRVDRTGPRPRQPDARDDLHFKVDGEKLTDDVGSQWRRAIADGSQRRRRVQCRRQLQWHRGRSSQGDRGRRRDQVHSPARGRRPAPAEFVAKRANRHGTTPECSSTPELSPTVDSNTS